MGAVLASSVVNEGLRELYDYDKIRSIREACVFLPRVRRPTLVLGSAQTKELLVNNVESRWNLRRRRGGGGVVLVAPGDLWVDFWIPRDDPRYNDDLTSTALMVAVWWHQALSKVVKSELTIHRGPAVGERSWRVVCFASIGSGEIALNGQKLVGVTQWRVRQGCLVSTLLAQKAQVAVAESLREVPDGLVGALQSQSRIQHTVESQNDEICRELLRAGGPWNTRSPIVD